ncbi:head-tail connector protein [Neptunicella sp.]|uniref:head-tail connector protein n=1 Tax=Neptunicella sp. TaxID=2125986 RepID=UPI003F68D3AE
MTILNRKLITEPVLEPVTLAELAQHTVIDCEDAARESAYLQSLITAARSRFEHYTSRFTVEQTWRLSMPFFKNEISIPLVPLRSVESVQYYDATGTQQTLDPSEYRVDDHGLLGVITPVSKWPAVQTRRDAVQINITVGHASTTGDNPVKLDATSIIENGKLQQAKQAIMILVSDWYNNREDTAVVQLHDMPNAFKALCSELSVNLL